MFLTRARLRRDRGLAALAPLLLPQGEGHRAGAAHRIIWTLFADTPDRRRDFLWREEKPGAYLLFSARPPLDVANLFTLDEPKPFVPALTEGDRLAFLLRANAVASRSEGKGVRGKRHDIIADALRSVGCDERSNLRWSLTQKAGCRWLAAQGEAAGFRLIEPIFVDGDEWREIPRPGHPAITFNVLDFAGHFRVTDPARFIPALEAGFGRAKAFGCGLMLIRRV